MFKKTIKLFGTINTDIVKFLYCLLIVNTLILTIQS